MATASVNIRIVCSLFAAAIVLACAIASLPVDGAPQSSVDDGSSAGDEFRGAASRGNNYALRLHQLQLMQAARHGGIARVAPVVDRKSIVDEKRDDSSAAFDVDYGWGGGRFGKRRNGDSLGLAGRFGRSVATSFDMDNADERN